MTLNYVILAAGRGSRMGRAGEHTHKALLPLDHKAMLTHQIERAPQDANIIVVTGYRDHLITEYLEAADHWDVATVHVEDWDGAGPAYSLMQAIDSQEWNPDEALFFTACDTYWEEDSAFLVRGSSWIGVAPIPAGSPTSRWCTVEHDDYDITAIHEKVDVAPNDDLELDAFIGAAYIAKADLPTFVSVLRATPREDAQTSPALRAVANAGRLEPKRLSWTDVGDASAYTQAVLSRQGYDWSKADQLTYLLPKTGRAVKFFASQGDVRQLKTRHAEQINPPRLLTGLNHFLGYQFLNGYITLYDAIDRGYFDPDDLDWVMSDLHAERRNAPRITITNGELDADATAFYDIRLGARISRLREPLRSIARAIVDEFIDVDDIVRQVQPTRRFHGDLTLANIMVPQKVDSPNLRFIDYRKDYAGQTVYGDLNYDIGKLYSSSLVNYERASRGDFSPWDKAGEVRAALDDSDYVTDTHRHIAALCLIGSAPLHTAPFDEILVRTAKKFMEEL